jgi:hypothetical protein
MEIEILTVEHYLNVLGRICEGFIPPKDPSKQFKLLSNTSINRTQQIPILDSLKVKYNGMRDFVKFTPNADNYHQFNALMTFLSKNPKIDEAIVKAIHSHGGIFTAKFTRSKAQANLVEYTSEIGRKTEFTFDI